jgi:cholinesterase
MTSILAAMPGAGPPGAGSSNFGPAIDEAVVFSNYLARSATGNFIKVPLIVGNTDYEAGLFKVTSALGGKYYPEIFWTLLDLQTFTCPSAARANMSISNKVPTWRYRWFGDFPNTALTLDSGAWHASEIPLIFNTVPYGTGIPGNIPNETEIGNYIRGAWATFAKDPVNGLKSYGGNGGWPVYDFGKKTLVRLAYMNYTGPNLALGDQYDAHCNSTFAVISNGTSVLPSTTTSTSVSPTGTATGAGESTSPTPTKSAGVETIVGWNNFGAVLMIGIAFAWLI